MERKLATIEKILEIHPIEGADAIERAVVRGWNIVIKKGDFSKGDLCVYCEIDSVLPEKDEFEFLRPRNFRIKTIKLRGQISQGIIFPLSVLEGLIEGQIGSSLYDTIGEDWIERDVTEIIGITKYDPPIPAELSGEVNGIFPSHSFKTDEERIQNLKTNYSSYQTETWYETEKLDGTSMTAFIYDNVFGISSRNYDLKESEFNSFWKVARRINLEEKMRAYMTKYNMKALTLQGELIGEGIQKNKYKLKGQDVRFFRAFDPIKYEFLPYKVFLSMIFDEMQLNTVPIISTNFILPDSYDELITYAEGRSELYETAREGIVFVAKDTANGDNGRLSFKIISNKFLLKHGD